MTDAATDHVVMTFKKLDREENEASDSCPLRKPQSPRLTRKPKNDRRGRNPNRV